MTFSCSSKSLSTHLGKKSVLKKIWVLKSLHVWCLCNFMILNSSKLLSSHFAPSTLVFLQFLKYIKLTPVSELYPCSVLFLEFLLFSQIFTKLAPSLHQVMLILTAMGRTSLSTIFIIVPCPTPAISIPLPAVLFLVAFASIWNEYYRLISLLVCLFLPAENKPLEGP